MEHRDVHARPKRLLDLEAVRRLDVFEIDAPERGLQRRHDLDEPLGIALLDFEVDRVDAGELLEQHRLAFHHRLGRESADRPQPQHGGAVGNDRHEIAAGGIERDLFRIGGDFLAGSGHAGRIGQRQVALVGQRLGGDDLELAGLRPGMEMQGGFAQRLLLFASIGGHQDPLSRCGALSRTKLDERKAALCP